MQAFYEGLREARDAKTREAAQAALTRAHVAMGLMLQAARARLELGYARDTLALFLWAVRECAYQHDGAERPEVYPFPLTPRAELPRDHRSSLDFRWRKEAEIPESWLPTVPLWTRGAA